MNVGANTKLRTRAAAVIAAVAAAVALAGCVPEPDPDAAPSVTPAAEDTFTPVLVSVVAAPVAAPSTDGLTHLAYELQVTNTLSQPVALNELTVLDGGAPLVTLAGADLAARTMTIGGGIGDSVLQDGRSALVFIDVAVAGDAVPMGLTHELTITPEEGHPPVFDTPMTETVASIDVSSAAAEPLGNPLRGAGWLNGNSCCDMTPHRLAVSPINGTYFAPERFAIDFVQLDAEGWMFSGPIDDLDSYAFEGAEVLAVADGTVVSVTADRPEQVAGANPDGGLTLDEYGGNYVVLDIGDGRYAFYAHLQPGNPAGIAVGQRVARGDVIGTLGNSGNTSGPHLHFHVMDSPSPLASNGLPFVFESFVLAGTVSADDMQACLEAAVPCGVRSESASERHNESSLYRDVLDFD